MIPDYFPPATGRYEVKPGLLRFGKPLGGGKADECVFQIDGTFPRYREAKLAARAERMSKYVQTDRFDPAVERVVTRFMLDRFTQEHPERMIDGVTFDALALQVQEDLAVIRIDGSRHWLSAIHLSFPNNWSAEDKIGKTFSHVHEPVAEMQRMNDQAEHLIAVMLDAMDGLVRFAWGITWDDQLNHHPENTWRRAFDVENPQAFLRVERQTIWGFPDAGAALFTIRTYLYDCAVIRQNAQRRANLVSALRSMSPATLMYKGLATSRDALIGWLECDD